MKKYYIEVEDITHDDVPCYILQSEWFETEKEAIAWANQISYLWQDFKVRLMQGEFDAKNPDIYEDISLVRYLGRKEGGR
mgnify:CR=1 FL=1